MNEILLSDRQKAFRQHVMECAEETMGKGYIEYARKSRRKDVRDKIIAMNHYYHILQLVGCDDIDKVRVYAYFDLAVEKITKIRDKELQRKEYIRLNLISLHTSAWNIAHFHYERAVKTLCMMMVTLMDYIIQEQGGASVLYHELDTTKYFNLLDEITSLNEDYKEDYFYICAFDFCTKKLGEYLNIPQYDNITMEHKRIISNGNPQRVSSIIERLKEIGGEKRAEVMGDIEKAYTPEPLYSEEIFEECYKEILAQYETEDDAMDEFNGFVSKVGSLYQLKVKQ